MPSQDTRSHGVGYLPSWVGSRWVVVDVPSPPIRLSAGLSPIGSIALPCCYITLPWPPNCLPVPAQPPCLLGYMTLSVRPHRLALLARCSALVCPCPGAGLLPSDTRALDSPGPRFALSRPNQARHPPNPYRDPDVRCILRGGLAVAAADGDDRQEAGQPRGRSGGGGDSDRAAQGKFTRRPSTWRRARARRTGRERGRPWCQRCLICLSPPTAMLAKYSNSLGGGGYERDPWIRNAAGPVVQA